jgi:peroxiredoxin
MICKHERLFKLFLIVKYKINLTLIFKILKMKTVNFLLIIALLTSSCNSSRFKVNGTLKNAAGETIFLKELGTTDRITIDSVKIDSDGEFKLKGKNSKPAFYSLQISKGNEITLIINPGEKLQITADAKDLLHTYNVIGSADSELAKELSNKLNEVLLKIDKLGQTYQDSLGSKNILAVRAQLDSAFKLIELEHRAYTKAFIRTNIHSMASIMALYQQFTPRHSVLNPDEHFEFYKIVDSVMYKTHPDADAVISLHNLMVNIEDGHRLKSETHKRVAIGAMVPEIALENPRGALLKLSSMKGKYVLVDFWASWKDSSRFENKNLTRLYWRYKNVGFDIYQISLDKNKESWMKAITDDGLFWYHVSDLKMWNSPVVALFGIENIPSNLLIDPEGRIIAKNLLGNNLSAKLQSIFKY